MGIEKEEPEDPRTFHILDESPDTMSRLIAYHAGKGYAATWVHIQRKVAEGEDKHGNHQTYDPPKIETKEELVIVSSDGHLYSDAPIPNAVPLSKTALSLHLTEIPTTAGRWSGAGVNRMLQGTHPNPVAVFEDVRTVVDHFMDFHGSFTDQKTLCDLITCWVISTYFLDVIPVTGYLWPNGEAGSGKSHLLYIISTVAYLGMVITAGGSFAAIRDMAGYGGTLLFDDAEKIMDTKNGDPDKQALLLAGNRKGTTVPLKVPTANRGWETRHINAFCPKAFSAIVLPIETLASRTIFIPLLASDNSEKANSDPLDFDNWPAGIDRRRLVDDLWTMALLNLGSVALADRKMAQETTMAGRAFQPWRAILSVASWLDDKGADGILQTMIDAAKAYRNDAYLANSTNQAAIVMRALRRIVDAKLLQSPKADSVIFATKDLHAAVNAIAHELDLVGDDEDFITAKSLGWRLRRMRLDKPDARNPSAREWKITIAGLEKAERARGIHSPDKTSQTAETAQTSQDDDVPDVSGKSDVCPESIRRSPDVNDDSDKSDVSFLTEKTRYQETF